MIFQGEKRMKLYTLLCSCLLVTPLFANEAETKQEPSTLAKEEKSSNQEEQKLVEVLEFNLSQEGAGDSDKFVANGRIGVKFILNAHQAGKLNVVWMNGDRVYATIPINVKMASPKWHGHADIRAFAGDWKVQITDESGKVLSEKTFAVAASTGETSSEDVTSKNQNNPKKIGEVLATLEPGTEKNKAPQK